jgi:hypothetical protein
MWAIVRDEMTYYTDAFTLTYRTWNRTTRQRRTVRATIRATTRFGALRAWWAIQRQYQPLVEVVSLERHLNYQWIRAEEDWQRMHA